MDIFMSKNNTMQFLRLQPKNRIEQLRRNLINFESLVFEQHGPGFKCTIRLMAGNSTVFFIAKHPKYKKPVKHVSTLCFHAIGFPFGFAFATENPCFANLPQEEYGE